MPAMISSHTFEAQMARIKAVTGLKTQCQLAEVFGIAQASIAAAAKRGQIPAGWLVVLVQKFRVNPDWILEGALPVFLHDGDGERLPEGVAGQLESDILRKVPTETLLEELLRRSRKPQ